MKTKGNLLSNIVDATHELLLARGQLYEIESFTEALSLWKDLFPGSTPNKGGRGKESLFQELSREAGDTPEGLSESQMKELQDSLKGGKEQGNE